MASILRLGTGEQLGSGNNHALQDYQMQLLLLEQQNKKRLMMARQEQEQMDGIILEGPGTNIEKEDDAKLRDHQVQLNLPEEQNKRVMMAPQEQVHMSDSRGSYLDQSFPSSPTTASFRSSPVGSDCDIPQRKSRASSSTSTSSLQLAPPNSILYDRSGEIDNLPLFNIGKDGDPRISWISYYNFVVTKTESFYELKPGYVETEKFPARVSMENPKMK
jgi:hypothetical protein